MLPSQPNHGSLSGSALAWQNAQFHDEIMRQGGMPISLLRLAVNNRLKLTRDMDVDWKFYGELSR